MKSDHITRLSQAHFPPVSLSQVCNALKATDHVIAKSFVRMLQTGMTYYFF